MAGADFKDDAKAFAEGDLVKGREFKDDSNKKAVSNAAALSVGNAGQSAGSIKLAPADKGGMSVACKDPKDLGKLVEITWDAKTGKGFKAKWDPDNVCSNVFFCCCENECPSLFFALCFF